MERELVVRSNQLIEASYHLGLVEQRIILMSIVRARETGQGVTPETLLHVRADEYAKLFDVEPHTAYEALIDAVNTLFNRRVTIQTYDPKLKKEVPLTIRWLTGMNYLKNEGMVSLRFTSEVLPHITRLESNFTSYPLGEVSGLQSGYAVRLYELLTKWRKIGKTPLMELTEFREQLGLDGGEYKRMEHFKTRVLDLALKQINANTDLVASYEQQKSGRIITGFTFDIKPKKAKPEAKKAPAPRKKTKKEQQLDLLQPHKPLFSAEAVKMSADFDSLADDDKALVLKNIKKELSGLRRSQFAIELSAYNAKKSPAIFEQYKDYFSRGLAVLGFL